MKTLLETDRLILRELFVQDAHHIFQLDSDPDVHIFLGNKPITTLKEAEQSIHFIRNQYQKYGIGRWATLTKDTEQFIGWAGLKYISTAINGKAGYYDLGYRLLKQYWGKGYATELAKVFLKHGFESLNLKTINAFVNIDNTASITILKKVGMQFINQFEYDGHPHFFYGINKADWLKTI